ncbi:hypothetical protein CU633_04965 [Bacillus sp. V3-13]|uniref:hypothetical protein n=1 Tax=Bacillus sp. V3-13 TaxID=2053728 RepID=UPI000C793882|nr:hypothetical protein [Bacillus sp. V3-13]PLR78581.1 hypothetical protein CU633_04965 [Bacillus sp. V3-13]
MAFGINRQELQEWKKKIAAGEIAFLTHYWLDERFPGCNTVTKVGCSNIGKLAKWGAKYNLKPEWIHHRKDFPHFDLLGSRQVEILKAEGLFEHIW